MSIQDEADELIEKFRKDLEIEKLALVEKHRRYIKGFRFYFRGEDDTKPDPCEIFESFLGVDQTVWYRCKGSSYWLLDEHGDIMPDAFLIMSESVVDRAIEKYGLYRSTTAKT
jgi:hypothetical protein